jgi:toxin HigB-1
MLDAKRIRHRALRRLVKSGDGSKINPKWLRRVQNILSMLHIAVHPTELDLPGFALHELKHNRKGTYAVTVEGNWRITFKWDEEGPYDVDLEDYHGR